MEKRTRKFGDLFLKYAIWGDELRVDKDSLYINTENYKWESGMGEYVGKPKKA